jgi:hypothetical protein
MRVDHANITPNATSQPLPVEPMLRGNGGGAPDGRRCLCPLRIVGGGALGAEAHVVGPTSVVT